MAVTVTVHPKDAPRGEEVSYQNVTKWSFIDTNSHGPMHNFGMTNVDTFEGRALYINSALTDLVVVDGQS